MIGTPANLSGLLIPLARCEVMFEQRQVAGASWRGSHGRIRDPSIGLLGDWDYLVGVSREVVNRSSTHRRPANGQVVTNSERHLGLFWSKGHPKGGLEGIRPLSAAEETELLEATRILRGFVNRPAFVLQIEMYRSVTAAISSLAMLPVSLGPNQARRRDAVELGNTLTLWLEATRMFLDQTETLIKRGYGKNSSQWSTWKTLKQRLHSSHLGYDLLYAVRNSLHTAAVPLKITVATSEVAPDEVRQSLDLTLDATALCKDGDLNRWFRKHTDIETASLDVQSLVTEMQGCMEELKRVVMLMDIEAARESTRTIRKYSDEAFAEGDPSSSWPITFKVGAGEHSQLSDLTFLPIDCQWPLVSPHGRP